MTPDQITALIDATWPAASHTEIGPWTIREGKGAGSRVSAATARQPARADELPLAVDAMRDLGQTPIFMVRSGEASLDTLLAGRGYIIKDPVTVYTAPITAIATNRPPRLTCFEVYPPLAVQEEIWAAGGVGPARLAVMHRAPGPRTTILGRMDDTPAGTLFVAIHDGTAMVHAVETAARFRRKGLARHMMRAAAFWARDNGAQTLALLVTDANQGANALYSSLGMHAAAGYHYRIHPEAP